MLNLGRPQGGIEVIIWDVSSSKNQNPSRKPNITQILIEIIKVFEILWIIAGTILIYATNRIFGFSVKSGSRQMRVRDNKKGKSIGSDSPFWVWISSWYPKWILREFRSNHVGILWRRCRPKNKDITKIFRLRKAVFVGGTCICIQEVDKKGRVKTEPCLEFLIKKTDFRSSSE